MTCDVLREPLEPASNDPGILTRRQLVLSYRPPKGKREASWSLGRGHHHAQRGPRDKTKTSFTGSKGLPPALSRAIPSPGALDVTVYQCV